MRPGLFLAVGFGRCGIGEDDPEFAAVAELCSSDAADRVFLSALLGGNFNGPIGRLPMNACRLAIVSFASILSPISRLSSMTFGAPYVGDRRGCTDMLRAIDFFLTC